MVLIAFINMTVLLIEQIFHNFEDQKIASFYGKVVFGSAQGPPILTTIVFFPSNVSNPYNSKRRKNEMIGLTDLSLIGKNILRSSGTSFPQKGF